MDIVAVNINKMINEKGLKKMIVAKKAGYSYQAFSNMLNGRKTIKGTDVFNIAMALETTPNELLGFPEAVAE